MTKRDPSFKGFCFVFATVAGAALVAETLYKTEPATVHKAPLVEATPKTYTSQTVNVHINRSNGENHEGDLHYTKTISGTFAYPEKDISIGGGWNLPAQDEICITYKNEAGKMLHDTKDCNSFYRLPKQEKANYIADALVHGMSVTDVPKVFDPAYNNETTVPSKHVRFIVQGDYGVGRASQNFYYDQPTPRYEATTSHLLHLGKGDNVWYRVSDFHFNEESDQEKTEFTFLNKITLDQARDILAQFNESGAYARHTVKQEGYGPKTAKTIDLSASEQNGQRDYSISYQRKAIKFVM